MSTSTGRGSRTDAEATLASVRPLHHSDRDGGEAAGEWYETERFAGQIVGGGRRAALPLTPSEMSAVLDWRHAELAPAPSVLRRLARALADRRSGASAVVSGSRPADESDRSPRPAVSARLSTRLRRWIVAAGLGGAVNAPVTDGPELERDVVPAAASNRSADLSDERLGWRSAVREREHGGHRGRLSPGWLLAAAVRGRERDHCPDARRRPADQRLWPPPWQPQNPGGRGSMAPAARTFGSRG